MSLFSIVTDILSYWWVIPVVWIGFRIIRIFFLVPFFPQLDFEKIEKERIGKEEEKERKRIQGIKGYDKSIYQKVREQGELTTSYIEEIQKEQEEEGIRKEEKRRKQNEEWSIYVKNQEEERLLREKELEPLRKKKEFWYGLSGLDTEDELDKVFEKLGFETELTPPSNDEGIDHILNGEIVVQTKNQQKKVTRPDLQRFWGSWKDSHKKGIFVSIHGFSNTCEEFVKLEDKPILLYDVDDVVRMMEGKKPEWNE